MYITNITDGYNDTLSVNNNWTNNDNNFELIIPLFTKIPCGMSIMCLKSRMVYTLMKPLFDIKWLRNFYTQVVQLDVS